MMLLTRSTTARSETHQCSTLPCRHYKQMWRSSSCWHNYSNVPTEISSVTYTMLSRQTSYTQDQSVYTPLERQTVEPLEAFDSDKRSSVLRHFRSRRQQQWERTVSGHSDCRSGFRLDAGCAGRELPINGVRTSRPRPQHSHLHVEIIK